METDETLSDAIGSPAFAEAAAAAAASVDTTTADMFAGLSVAELRRLKKLVELRERRLYFAQEHHRNTKGEPMDFAHFPHIRSIYMSLSPTIVLQGSVQSFKSEWAIIDHLAMADCGLAVFFVLPKFEMRTTYVQNRVDRCVDNVPEYKRIVGEGFSDSVALKSFGRGVIKYVGSNVLADFREFPADAIVVEEVDECSGENLKYAVDRTRASSYQFMRWLGNPKHTNEGINALFINSDQREWAVPCKSCGEYSELDWFQVVAEEICDKDGNVVDYRLRDREWSVGCRRDIYMVCPHCNGELDRQSPEGKWIPKNPGHPVEGYHISMMCAPTNSIAGMWADFQAGQTNPTLLQHFFNSNLGLPFTAVGNRVTPSLLDQCAEPEYEFVIRPDCAHIAEDCHPGPCSMGVDVGGTFDVRISAMEGMKRRAVYVGKVRNVDDLHDLIERYSVEKVIMDSMPEMMIAQEFQDAAQCDVWLCKYGDEGSDRRKSLDPKSRIFTIDRTEALDRSYAQLRQHKNILPVNYASMISGMYLREMCGPIREVTLDSKGNLRYIWTKCTDHQRHADTYDMLAAMLARDSVIDSVSVG